MASPKKGDRLTKSHDKIRDRVYISPGCVPNGYNLPQPIKGTILQSQVFGGVTRYHVIMDGASPPGLWYDQSCITVKQGVLQSHNPSKQAWCVVKSPDGEYWARFLLDQNGVDSYLIEGFDVVLDDDTNVPS